MSNLKTKGILIKKADKSIKTDNPESLRELKEKLHKEIQSKSKLCSNPTYECSLQRLDGYEYCMKHILLDPNAPYKQCSYVYSSNGKRCQEAAGDQSASSIYPLSNFCFEHTRITQLKETRQVIGKFKPFESTETLVNSLAHHVKLDKLKPQNNSKLQAHDDEEEEVDIVTPSVDPFVDLNANELNNAGRNILDYASDSSSEDEATTLANTWRGYEMDNSDNESVDSEADDPLKHAGIYTAEEATMITKEKLIRLKSLYVDQFLRLQHVLKEKRKHYLLNIKREKESLSSIHDQPKDSPRERKLYEKLKALNHYHKRYGTEAILRRKYIERRTNSAEVANKNIPKCHFMEGGVKCLEKSLPCIKYCKRHVLEDKKQFLFKACGIEKSGIVCQEPVANIFEDATCTLHIPLPSPKVYTKKKYESETEDEDEIKLEDIKEEPKVEVKTNSDEVPESSQIQENNITIAHEPMEVDEEMKPKKEPLNNSATEIEVT